MFGYETANEEVRARVDTLRKSAVNARARAQDLNEQSRRESKAAVHCDRLADEYEALLVQATATN